MVDFLEDRLERVSADSVYGVISALKVPHINPRENWSAMPYLKDDLTIRISEGIGESNDFAQVVYSAVNKDVLKRVLYGIMSVGEMPPEFLQALTPWEKVYFFRGRWYERTPDLSEPLEVLTSKHIHCGLEQLHADHFKRKAKGVYTSTKKFPEADRIRADYQRITQF